MDKSRIVELAKGEIDRILRGYNVATTLFLRDYDVFNDIVQEMWCEGYIMGYRDNSVENKRASDCDGGEYATRKKKEKI